jgi:hypothetical protein
MAWIGITDHRSAQFDAQGLGPEGAGPGAAQVSIPADLLVPCGSLVIETGLTPRRRPHPLLSYAQSGAGPLQLNLQTIPGGGLTLVVSNGSDLHHCTIPHAETGRTDVLRISYCWDGPRRRGFIALERSDTDTVSLFPIRAPRPVYMRDLRALCLGEGRSAMSDDVICLSVATHVEPVGPAPTLGMHTPVATPDGWRYISDLKRGDTVLTAEGGVTPVLHKITRTVPARGSFRPIRLRAPYFGLKQDIIAAPSQCLLVRGSEVEYLFGHEAVLAPAGHLAGASAAMAEAVAGTITYCQLLLPGHEAVNAAGTDAASLNIGRLRRKHEVLQASQLADLEPAFLPDHGRCMYPVLRAYDTQVLADYRAA